MILAQLSPSLFLTSLQWRIKIFQITCNLICFNLIVLIKQSLNNVKWLIHYSAFLHSFPSIFEIHVWHIWKSEQKFSKTSISNIFFRHWGDKTRESFAETRPFKEQLCNGGYIRMLCMFTICKLQYNSFSIPLATDGLGAKSPTIPPVFDTQITSITETKTSPSISVFTFDALPFFLLFIWCNNR